MWPAFIASTLASAIALIAARSGWRDLPVSARGDRRAIWATATWAFGIVLLASGIIGFRTRDDPLRPLLVGAGVVILVLGLVFERLRPHLPDIGSRVDRRAVSVALFVGFIVGYAQTAPLVQLPIYFQIALGYGPILAVVATIPFMAALVVAGPVAGILIGRFQPRTIVVWGVAAVGAGNILAALVLGPRTPYLGFGVAMLLIGAGFVVATTVRTAIIFASVPRGLPATAAALNEVSVSMGARAALVLVTTFVAGAATSAYGGSLVGHPPAEVDAALAQFHAFLLAIGTPGFPALIAGTNSAGPGGIQLGLYRRGPGRAAVEWAGRPGGIGHRRDRPRSAGPAADRLGAPGRAGPDGRRGYDCCGTVVSRSRRQPKRSMIR